MATRVVDIPSSRMANFLGFQRDPLGFLVDTLPLGEVVSLRTSAFRPTFIVNSPDFVQEILVTQDAAFRKGRSTNVLRRTIGEGLLTSEHHTHRQQKRYLMPVFYKERIQSYANIVVEETEKLADQLREDVPVPMHETMMQLTLGIIARTMFHTELAEEKAELAEAVDDTIRQTAKTLFSPLILPLAVPTAGNRKHKKAIRTLERMVYDVIAKAKERPEVYTDSMLGLLLDTKDESGEPLPDEEIRDQMMTMLLAGHETTANAMGWAWYGLEQNPEAAERLRAELASVDGTGDASAYDLYRELPYAKQVIQETLRLYPPAWMILRETEQAVEMLGESFPANSSFLISPYAIHRNEHVFADAAAFRPERFDQGLNAWPRFAYFPFGGGSRGCIGSQFAMLEAVLILSTLARRFKFVSVEGQGTAIPEPLVSLRIKNGREMVPIRL
ncbi:pyridine nucleotide-disulfide oxidoreductase [Paenibacillus swuensis]|uniref:Pyridine nucleotide-disulfide oxidoreductase n=1 Tax=Paenibacillus swuensis TaxID=1178515 RepID=A0A172TIL8_9BACL|nr:cytochrome P450 [Paenibacillus swuensis]ANE46909.1 pyridine nucleotide-disulfide oxidoreductase [Paenibacillus swuensis]